MPGESPSLADTDFSDMRGSVLCLLQRPRGDGANGDATWHSSRVSEDFGGSRVGRGKRLGSPRIRMRAVGVTATHSSGPDKVARERSNMKCQMGLHTHGIRGRHLEVAQVRVVGLLVCFSASVLWPRSSDRCNRSFFGLDCGILWAGAEMRR